MEREREREVGLQKLMKEKNEIVFKKWKENN